MLAAGGYDEFTLSARFDIVLLHEPPDSFFPNSHTIPRKVHCRFFWRPIETKGGFLRFELRPCFIKVLVGLEWSGLDHLWAASIE